MDYYDTNERRKKAELIRQFSELVYSDRGDFYYDDYGYENKTLTVFYKSNNDSIALRFHRPIGTKNSMLCTASGLYSNFTVCGKLAWERYNTALDEINDAEYGVGNELHEDLFNKVSDQTEYL